MRLTTHRIAVAGLSGDSGKPLLALGLVRAFASRGLGVAPFKKGPDYIDAAWLGAAAKRPGRNLDTFLMDDAALGSALATSAGSDLIVVEGNRGLFDGVDAAGTHSTAELAKRIGAPLLLLVDVSRMTRTAPELLFADGVRLVKGARALIAVVRDEAFSFYYPENLEALEARGAELLFVSALADEVIPEVDAVYVGGGFPEVYAARLAAAGAFLASLREKAARHVPIYAECGGLMLLARSLAVDGTAHEMAGILDLDVVQERRPQGHGYAVARVDRVAVSLR